jgi:hypothetical protein
VWEGIETVERIGLVVGVARGFDEIEHWRGTGIEAFGVPAPLCKWALGEGCRKLGDRVGQVLRSFCLDRSICPSSPVILTSSA